MLPGLGKIDPKKMQGMLKQLGVSQQEIEAERVIIEKQNGKIIIESPSVQKITMHGQTSYQITGEAKESAEEKITEEDIKLVAEKTSSSYEKAKKALEQTNGDIAEAIAKLSD